MVRCTEHQRCDRIRRTGIQAGAAFRRRDDELGFKTPDVVVDFAVGDTVVVTAGAWKDTVGVIRTVNESKQSITINVEMFGRETPVELSFSEIKKM